MECLQQVPGILGTILEFFLPQLSTMVLNPGQFFSLGEI